jgi:uncharacterized membrane protein
MIEAIIAGVVAIGVAVIEFFAARDRKKAKADREKAAEDRAIAEKRHQIRQAESILSMKLLYATGKLSEATALAVKRGYANGEIDEGLELFTKAEEKYKDFCLEQTQGLVS